MRAKLFNEEKLIRYSPGHRFLHKICSSLSNRTPPSPHFLRSIVVEPELPVLAGAGKTAGSSSVNMLLTCFTGVNLQIFLSKCLFAENIVLIFVTVIFLFPTF